MRVLDTNVLLAATDESRQRHRQALTLLQDGATDLAVSPQIVREYLSVASRPVAGNGLGLAGADAVANVEQILERVALLPENASSIGWLLALISAEATSGKQVHDANVVAVALAHRAAAVITDNARHFVRFADRIAVELL